MKPHVKLRRRSNLGVVVPFKRTPDADIVEMLGEVYQAVQGGDIQGMAIACIGTDGSTHTCYVGSKHIVHLIGATEYLSHRLKTQALQQP